jgi:putative membrane protein
MDRDFTAPRPKHARHSSTPLLLNPHVPFLQNRVLQLLIVVFAAFWIYMAFSPTNRMQWLMENMLPVAAVLALAFTYRKYRLSTLSYLLLFGFFCLHTYAAHYTYQNTPFDVWLKSAFHTERSYFDRVVHCAFGLLWAYPVRELLVRKTDLRGVWSYAVSVSIVFSCSALFEVMEMFVTLIGGQAGEDYLGMQGDLFDSQKDIALGMAGAVVAMGVLAWINKYRKTAR